MTSEVSICNTALIEANAATITSLLEDSSSAVRCSIFYPQVRDEVLRAHPWNFAIAQQALELDADAPVFEFLHKFTLPEDCLRVLKLDSNYKFKIKGRALHTDIGTAKIEYIKRETDPTLYDSLFVSALATRLAHRISYATHGDKERIQQLASDYDTIMREAKRRDGQEGIPDDLTADLWVKSRSSWTGDY